RWRCSPRASQATAEAASIQQPAPAVADAAVVAAGDAAVDRLAGADQLLAAVLGQRAEGQRAGALGRLLQERLEGNGDVEALVEAAFAEHVERHIGQGGEGANADAGIELAAEPV